MFAETSISFWLFGVTGVYIYIYIVLMLSKLKGQGDPVCLESAAAPADATTACNLIHF